MNRYVLVLDVPPLPIFPNSYMLDSLKFPKYWCPVNNTLHIRSA